MSAYYNEIDPFAAQWLRNLIAAGHIAPGDVDERSVEDVQPDDLAEYIQCHFFAGIGVWSHALRTAGWADDMAAWTGSCPCQPFSAAGKRGGFDDARHLWPAWSRLIAERRPRVVFGEQVASKDGYAWLDAVQADLEGLDYACGPVVLPAAGFGAPHGRHRIYFVADSDQGQRRSGRIVAGTAGRSQPELAGPGVAGLMADASDSRRRTGIDPLSGRAQPDDAGSGFAFGMADDEAGRRREVDPVAGRGDAGDGAQGGQRPVRSDDPDVPVEDAERTASPRLGQHGWPGLREQEAAGLAGPGGTGGWWRDAEWIWCRDEKYRPTQPGLQPLAHGATARVGRLRAYGNAIVAPVAAEFVSAYMSARP